MKRLLNKAGILSLIILAISFMGCEDDDDADGLPRVVAVFSQTIIEGTGTVTFINLSQNADSFMWDFGDGTTSTEIDPIKTFAEGTFTVTLTARNAAGAANAFEDEITIDLPDPPPAFDSGLLTNGDFEAGVEPWIGNAANVQTEGGNSFNFANVETAGEAFAVNLSQVVEITQGTNYILTFNASSDRERTILAGIGLNEDPFTNTAPEVTLTTDTQTFTLQLAAADFGSANSRVLFDLGADVGVVVIDNVSLVEGGDGSDTNGGGMAFDSGLLTNGDFEAGAAPWIQGVDDSNPAPVVTENGNTFYSINVTTPDAGQPFLVNLSQKLEIVQDETYTLTFDAWSDTDRSIIAGIGLSGGDFSNDTETVNITTTQETYSVVVTAGGFGAPDARVLFDLNAEAGLVNIDNVSLVVGGTSTGDSVAPVITLNGDAVVNLIVNDTFTDPGATANDDTDGDISGNIMVGGDTVDTSVAGTYVITYDVSDAAGNPAAQVTRTVNVMDFDSGLLVNGDFEDGAAPWIQGVDDSNPAPVVTENGNTFYQINVTSPDPGQPFLVNLSQKLAITPDATYILTFDAWSDTDRSIIAGIGLSGGSFANTSESVDINTTRQTYTRTLTATGFGDATSRVLFDLNGEAGLVNIDNVSLVLDAGGGGGGSACTIGSAPTGPASTLPVGFEDCVGFDSTFGGVTAVLADNPSATGINTSATVLRVEKPTTADFFGGFQNSAAFNTGQFNGNSITVTFQVYSNLNDITFRCELIANPTPNPDLGNPLPQFATLGSSDANTWVELSVTFTPNPGAETDYYNFLVIKPDDNQDDPNGAETDPPAADGIYFIDNITVQ
ncbi:immunoglobulin-like domain-containing protein [Flagellimonas sp.]|uniref:immunoglobulin-like domain-containing protein n=1 Tax=Flagellimonas sp. TaxID=2058762 RepID=UPI003F4A3014